MPRPPSGRVVLSVRIAEEVVAALDEAVEHMKLPNQPVDRAQMIRAWIALGRTRWASLNPGQRRDITRDSA